MAKGEEGRTLRVEPIDEHVLIGRLVGMSPGLLVNKFTKEAQAKITAPEPSGKKPKRRATKSAEDEWRPKLHMPYGEDGGYWFPSSGVLGAIIGAARLTELKMVEVGMMVGVEDEYFRIEGSEPILNDSMGRPQGPKRPPVPARRAQFVSWEMEVRLFYIASAIDQEELLNLVQIAGKCIGIGSWRRENRGPYGRFTFEAEMEDVPLLDPRLNRAG